MKIYIVYDSQNGHTEAIAKSVAEGAKLTEQTEVILKHVKDAEINDLSTADAIIWGCPGYFGTISAGLKEWIDRLVSFWAQGTLIGKVGAVFCTAASVHGGIETTLLNLLIPMLHQGMIIAGLPGNIPENALYGSYYGLGVTCPVENDPDAPITPPSEYNVALGRALGKRVAEITAKLIND